MPQTSKQAISWVFSQGQGNNTSSPLSSRVNIFIVFERTHKLKVGCAGVPARCLLFLNSDAGVGQWQS